MGIFADKLNRLFEQVRKEDGKRYTNQEIEALTGGEVSTSYISRLRTGKEDNPSLLKIQALARAFAVDAAWFFHDSADALLDGIALRAGQLDERGKQAVLGMIDHILDLQAAYDDTDDANNPDTKDAAS